MDRKIILSWNTISLVVPEKEDIDLYHNGMNNIQTQHYLWYSARTFSREDEEKYFENMNKGDKSQTFCIMINDTKKIIWNVWLNEINHINKWWTFWIVIFESEDRGNWYGQEAIELLHDFAKQQLNLRKLCLHVYWDNQKAIKLYTKIGYKEVWRWEKHKFYNWEFIDDVMMEIFL